MRSKLKPMREPGRKWTEDDDRKLYAAGQLAADCFVGECDEAWDAIAKLLGRTAPACRTRYSKLKHNVRYRRKYAWIREQV